MKALKILCLIIAFAVTAGASFALGRITADTLAVPSVTFYATIDDISGNHLTVSGLEVNDINTRGQFTFSIDEDTVLEWRYTALTADELDAGDTIAVTYTGYVLETYPARLEKILKIQLLDDEK